MGLFASIAIGLGALASVGQYTAAKKSAKAQQQSADLQQQQADLSATYSRKQAFRQSQLTRANTLMSGIGAGGIGGSGLSGAMSSVSSQTGATVGYQSQINSLSGLITEKTKEISSLNMRAQTFGQFSSLAFGAAKAGSFSKFFLGENG